MQPLVICDIDGTLTEYRRFIRKYAVPYFEKKYGLKVIDAGGLEIEDIFCLSEKYTLQDQKKMLDDFWISHRFIRFSLLDHYRKDAVSFIRKLKRKGFRIELHTSRAKTTDKTLVGLIARTFTIWQCWLSGCYISSRSIHFYSNDEKKAEGIISSHPTLVFEDKPDLIRSYSNADLKSCMLNETVEGEIGLLVDNVACITGFDETGILQACGQLFGHSYWNIIEREAASDKTFRELLPLCDLTRLIFRPVCINEPKTIAGQAVIYAPNHIKTVDPLVLESVIKKNIHWVALKRFFDGEDSIFNNSKNRILCEITKRLFKRLDFFPVERRTDNKNANNFKSIKEMQLFLHQGFNVGIFPEGTTRKQGDNFFGTFDSGFAELSISNNAVKQPVLLYWAKRPIIYWGQVIVPENKDVDGIMKRYEEIQNQGLMLCREYVENGDKSNLKE